MIEGAGAIAASPQDAETARIENFVPRYGCDITEHTLPQETQQMHALHFQKGCYLGQEIVERIRSRGQVRRKFTGFEIHGALPAPGSKVQVDGKDVGEITSVASLPFEAGDRPVALGYIRREVATPDKIVDAGGSEARIKNPPLAELSK